MNRIVRTAICICLNNRAQDGIVLGYTYNTASGPAAQFRMVFDAKPDGDDMRQFVCSGVNFDIDEKPLKQKRRMKSEGVEPRFGLGSLRARADSKPIPKKSVKRKVRRNKKDNSNMQSLYTFESTNKNENHNHQDLGCPNCNETLDVAKMLEKLEPYISQIVNRRLADREADLRRDLVEEFQRRRMAAENSIAPL
tara:strand:- start:438 stop:1022 length:585 start_codon:yes stop_codon:yes gene_type:complete